MTTTTVTLNNQGRGEVQLISETGKIGKMDIAVQDKQLVVYHTEVDKQYEGQGLAKLLLEKLVSYARESELKIVPLCPYVHAQFKRNPEAYDDIWEKSRTDG